MAVANGGRGAATIQTTTGGTKGQRATNTPVVPGGKAPRAFPTTELVSDPVQLARFLRSLHLELDGLGASLVTPFTSSALITSQAFVGGTARYVTHGLGRAPLGWLCTRSKTAAWAGFEVTLDAGRNAKTEIKLQTATSGTFDLLFF